MSSPSRRRHVRVALAGLLVTVLTILAGVVTAAPAAAAPSSTEQDVARMVNEFRAANGRPPLALDAGMSDDARAWSSRMAASGLAHDPNYTRTCDRFPGRTTCKENVAYASSAAAAQRSLEASSTHRANLLCDCTHLGVGTVSSGGRVWLTQRFVEAGAGTAYASAPSAEDLAAAENFVRSAYGDLLGRTATQSEVDHWKTRVGSPDQRLAFARALGYSDEWVGALVDGFYEVALGRAADADGRRYWIDVIRSRRLPPAAVAAHFYGSDEYFARRGNDLGRWVDDLYVELLERAADATGREHWTSVGRSYGRGVVSDSFYGSAESLHRRIDTLYRDLLGRAVDGAGRDHWAGELHRSGNDVDLAVSLVASTEYHRRAQS